ncbi:LOW QUALITY PROTEIN: O-acyltransferase like protein [Amyelois transitella]|uniref:LOW QUALITY PROTEIN: O-acyltransferase like protein n=1 Tax=Amyelois transitella TaxID=680683 RepID=UPI00298F5699|nr:LOW QUALITY PROTEIN: O-acyltransferase like protein [Amyelois transitella]
MKLSICLFYLTISSSANAYLETVIPDRKKAFDLNLYQDVLDPQKCQEQIRIVFNNSSVLNQFLDAGIRTPRGILKGNLVDLGNYHQCLEINENIENTNIEGKYCKISVPLEQEINWPPSLSNITFPENVTWPELPWTGMSSYKNRLTEVNIDQLRKLQVFKTEIRLMNFDDALGPLATNLDVTLAICIPKPCTSREVLSNFLGSLEDLGLQYTESSCRLPNDKKWVAADFTAIVIFSLLGILTIISTSYDVRQSVVLKRDPKSVNTLPIFLRVYKTRRLVTYTPVPGALECLDGIRSLAMIWVIIGHTFSNQNSGAHMANPLDMLNWVVSYKALWITTAPITVDTFFMMSGLLLVYTTAGKVTRMKFIKNIHMFYLNRLLRLLPVSAAVVLLQASIFNRVTDGPSWEMVAHQTEMCREYWWPTLLNIQNYYSPSSMCVPHLWYLAIDFQVFLISPIILFWVVSGRKRSAWLALSAGLAASLIASSIFNFIRDFPSSSINLSRLDDQLAYTQHYYINTLTRCPPFFVGMIYGYVLHVNKGKKLRIPKMQSLALWILAIGIIVTVVFTTHTIIQLDWDNQLADNFINSFMRPVWALSIGWIIFACSKGYGGPVNWVLSLRMWKLLSRLSYAMYVIHYPLILVHNGSALAPIYFSVEYSIHRFTTDFIITVVSAFLVTLFVDSPSSTLIKMFLGGPKRPAKEQTDMQDQRRDVNIVISPNEIAK